MGKIGGLVFISGLILCGAQLASGQAKSIPGRSSGQGSQISQAVAEKEQKAWMQLIKETSPKLYAFRKRLRYINDEIRKITEDFAKKKIDKETARQELLPLVKEEKEIRSNPVFLVEERLSPVYLSYPEHQARFKQIMDTLGKQGDADD